ncbi:MAG TPA: cysteine--tRNA ligase [bacterium]|nr:cysteine--tRNA ligase [bacterium]
MTLKIYNTLARRKEEFAPLVPGRVAMYVCGPNLYGPSHVGHAMSFLVFDVVHRYLEYRGYRVTHVQNFTDVEDRIIETARQEGTTIQALAARYIDRFLREMDGLGIRRADHYPRATETVPKMIEIIQGLERRGLAYAVDGDVFFRVAAFPRYGRLSGRSLDEMQAGARIEVDPRKEHPMDFVLWKAAKPDEPKWDSPWGAGRPGWHIECSAMSISLLGPQLDIHGGGQDVVFPHHENEIAQSEGYTGKHPFVRYWVHNGLLRLTADQEKMTRHLGNIVSIREALQRFHPDTIRVFVLSSHYRSPTLWSDEALEAATRGAERLRTALENADDVLAGPSSQAGAPRDGAAEPDRVFAELGAALRAGPDAIRARFETAMDDDFNTPGGLAALFDLASAINRVVDAVAKRRVALGPDGRATLAGGVALLRELGAVLGLRLVATATPVQAASLYRLARELAQERPDLFDPARLAAMPAPAAVGDDGADAGGAQAPSADAVFQPLVELIAEGRMRARQAKDWATGDRVRARLAELGVLLEDTPGGFKWRVR